MCVIETINKHYRHQRHNLPEDHRNTEERQVSIQINIKYNLQPGVTDIIKFSIH